MVIRAFPGKPCFFAEPFHFAESSDGGTKRSSAHLSRSYLISLKKNAIHRNYLTRSVNDLVQSWIIKTQDGTHQIQCEQEQILCLARRRLETVWQSWCRGGRFESQNSQFSFSNGNTLSSLHTLLRDGRENIERDGERHTGSLLLIQTVGRSICLKYSKED